MLQPTTIVSSSSIRYPTIKLTLGMVIIAIGPILVKLTGLDGFVAAFLRMVCAFPIIALYVYWQKNQHSHLQRELTLSRQRAFCWGLLLTGGFFGINIALWNQAVIVGSVAQGTILASTSPLWVALFSHLIYKTRLNLIDSIGLLTALLGICQLITHGEWWFGHLSWATFYGLGAGLFYAVYLLLVQHYRQNFDSIIISLWVTLGSIVALIPFLPLMLDLSLPNAHQEHVPWLIFLLGLTHVIATILVNDALGVINPTKASIMMLATPVLTAIFAAFIYKESLDKAQILGALIVLMGIGMVLIGQSHNKMP